AGAARHHQMGDSLYLDLLAQLRDRSERQLRRFLGIGLHAPRRGRRLAMVEAAGLVMRATAGRRRKHGPAMVDPAPLRHADEKPAHTLVLDLALGPVDEQPVHVMFGNSAREGVDVGASFTHACGPFGSDAPVCTSTATLSDRSVARRDLNFGQGMPASYKK